MQAEKKYASLSKPPRESLLSVDEFASNFLDCKPETTVYVDIGGELPLPVRAFPSSDSKTLVVLFHGAVDQSKRTLPAFLGFRPGVERHAHQISVADPTLALDKNLSNTWYCGSHGTPLQKLLPPFFERLKDALQVDRVVFVGSSGGGFAALYNSFHIAKSVAVVTVPQTNINEYYKSRRDAFLESCWKNADADSYPVLDLRTVYQKASSNGIVYIQSSLDALHLNKHMIPFLAALPEKKLARLSVKCSFWGKLSHSGAVPLIEWNAWIHAAINSKTVKSEDIVQAYYAIGVETAPSAALKVKEQRAQAQSLHSPSSVKNAVSPSAQDLTWSEMVVESHK